MIPKVGLRRRMDEPCGRTYRHIVKVRYVALVETDTRLPPDDLYCTFQYRAGKYRGPLDGGPKPVSAHLLPLAPSDPRRRLSVGVVMKRHDLSGCVTNEELAQLFDSAFATWRSDSTDPEGRRQTPRIAAGGVKPIFVVSYACAGREVELNRRATIADISADGLGVVLDEPVPVGSMVLFAFDGRGGKRSYGVASAVRATRHDDGARIGLTFLEDAESLEVDPSGDEVEGESLPAQGWQRGFLRLREAAAVACRVLARRQRARKMVGKVVDGKAAWLVVEAKLFRYTATLSVGGWEIVRQSGVLRDRFRSLFCDMALQTMVHLEGGGFSAWATLQANAVTYCNLDLSLPLKLQACSQVMSGVQSFPEASAASDATQVASAQE